MQGGLVMKKALSIMVLFFVLASTCMIPAKANSAMTSWSGISTAGTVFVGEDCPLEVTKEVLTFNLNEVPRTAGYEVIDLNVANSTVTAEYTFYNPSELEVTARLAFPFGKRPTYGISSINSFPTTLDGEEISKSLRYTLSSGKDFNLTEDLARLSDEYLSYGFFSPDMTVTKYVYDVFGTADMEFDLYKAFDVAINSEETRIYSPNTTYSTRLDNGYVRLGNRARTSKTITVYAIGEPLSKPLEWSFYSDYTMAEKKETTGSIQLTNTETTTLEELVMEYWDKNSSVSKVDWYNAVISGFNYREGYSILSNKYGLDVTEDLMYWYEYEITVGAGETVVNTVTAPMYPDVETVNDPPKFEYTYLLSPAGTWASFGELEINVNTPYYITASSIDGFTKTDTGYTLTLDGLPETELKFTLRSKPNALNELKSSVSPLANVPDYYFYAAGALAVAILGITVIVVIKKKNG